MHGAPHSSSPNLTASMNAMPGGWRWGPRNWRATWSKSTVLKHAGVGELHLRALPRANGFGIEMLAVDRAKGFDLEACMMDGFSTGGTQGIGLGAVARQTEVFDVHADARGAVLLARLYPRSDRQPDLRYGVSQHSLHNDPACGDTWHLAYNGAS